MYLFIMGQTLSIQGWHLWLSTIGAMLPFIIFAWNINRARKKDFKEIMNKKADIELVESELKLRDARIEYVENLSIISDKYLKETLEEQHTILDTVQSDIKKILIKLR